MRKILLLFVLASLRVLACDVPAHADVPIVNLNGQTLNFDVPPTIENGRVMVPMRTIFEALGAQVAWDATSSSVYATSGTTTIKLEIGGQAFINGAPTTLDAPAEIVDGRTLVPLRFVSEALNATVAWDGTNQTVTIVRPAPLITPNTPPASNNAFDAYLQTLPGRFIPANALFVFAVYQFNITGSADPGLYWVKIDNGLCTVGDGAVPDPTITINVTEQLWFDIASGKVAGREAFLEGQFTVVPVSNAKFLHNFWSYFTPENAPLTTSASNMQAFPLPVTTSVPLKALTAGSTVSFGGQTWIVLDPGAGYLLMQGFCGSSQQFDLADDDTFDPGNPNNIAYYLNSTFYNSLDAGDLPLIQSHSWTTGDEISDMSTTPAATCNIGLISISEFKTYQSYISTLSVCWWTRTPVHSFSGNNWGVTSSSYTDRPYGYARSNAFIFVRPALYLNPDTLVAGVNGGIVLGGEFNTVSVGESPVTGGTVTGGEGVWVYGDGNQVTVTATPNAGYSFVNWTENGSTVSSDATYTFTMGKTDRNLVANFAPVSNSGAAATPSVGGSTTPASSTSS